MARRRIGVADIKEVLVAWDAGEAISTIARRFGYSRPTVRKYVTAAQRAGLQRGGGRRDEATWDRVARATLAAVAAGRRPGAATMEVARHHDDLERQVGSVGLMVLHQRLRDDEGLRASWPTFYRYVATHWPERLRPAPRLTVRFDDPSPGEEAQIDFFYVGSWGDPESGRRRRLSAFLMTLGHSRHQFLYPVVAEDAPTWLEAHVAAFRFFGGAPRRLVPDNLTAGIIRADRYDPRLNRAYGELTRYYGCLVDPARVAHPQDKPRVERGVPYARGSFFAGRTFGSLGHMREDAERWAREVAGRRLHGTTRERPLDAFLEREQAALMPLPPRPWELVTWTSAKVQHDCHLRVAGADYSVPYRYVGQRLDVRVGRQLVEIYDGATAVTTHARREHGRATRLEHYPPAGQTFLRGTPQVCLGQAQALGPAADAVAAALLSPFTLTRLREVQALVRLAERFEPRRVERACQRALDAGDGRYKTIRGILEGGFDQLDPEPAAVHLSPAGAAGAHLRGPAAFRSASDLAGAGRW